MVKKKSSKNIKKHKKNKEKDPYEEALDILQGYEEGNPPILAEAED